MERYRRELGYESIRRVDVPTIEPEERLLHPENVVEIGYSREQAMREASRCLDCGVTPVFDGTRCVLCGGCADVCPTECLKLISLDRLEFDLDISATLDSALGEDADAERKLRNSKRRGPVHPLRTVRDAMPGGCDLDGAGHI